MNLVEILRHCWSTKKDHGDRSPSPAIKPGETLVSVVDLLAVK